MDLDLAGKTALVTGSYRGTGEGVAKVLAREGARVLVHGFEEGQPDRVVDEIRAEGHDAEGIVGDLLTDAGAEAAADAAEAAASAVDILVNNYGTAEGRGFEESETRDWLLSYEKNVLSGVRLTRLLLPEMRARGWGRILFVSTVGATRPGARMQHYYAAKAGLVNLSVSLAQELAGTGITVNTVSPGLIATREVKAMMMRRAQREGWDGDWDEIQRRGLKGFMDNPTGRIGTVEEVGDLVAFLVSDRAGYINGSNLRIDGGSAGVVN